MLNTVNLGAVRHYIGENSNWWIGDKDTNVPSKGDNGETPQFQVISNILQYKFPTQYPNEWTDLFDIINVGTGFGTSNYEELNNLPQIEGEVIVGNKTKADLGIASINEVEDIKLTLNNINVDINNLNNQIDDSNNNISINTDTLLNHVADSNAHHNQFSSKFDLVDANNLFKDVDYNQETGVMTFVKFNNTSIPLNLPLGSIIKKGYFDEVTNEIVLVLSDNSEIKIPASALIEDYKGDSTATVQVNVSDDNKISANLIGGSVEEMHFNTELLSSINDLREKQHTHTNKIIIDKITQSNIDNWNSVLDKANKEDVRNFNNNPINLKTEVIGILPSKNIDVSLVQGEQGVDGKSAYETAYENGYTKDENTFNLTLASIDIDKIRIPVTITITYEDGQPLVNKPIIIQVVGSVEQYVNLDENGQFMQYFLTNTDYTIKILRNPGDLYFSTIKSFQTGTLGIPLDIDLKVVSGTEYSSPVSFDDIQSTVIENAGIESNQTVSAFGNVSGGGSNRWIGGVLAPDGCIYGIPSGHTSILKIDPITQTTSLFGSFGSGTAKWYGGTLAPDGCIYGMPSSHTSILKIDPVTQTTSLFGNLGSSNSKWVSGVLAPDGCIYGIPCYSSSVLKIDPITQTTSLFGSFGSGTAKWYGGTLAPDGCIYGIPGSTGASSVLKIDPITQTTSLLGNLGSGDAKWYGGALAPDGCIYGIPFNSTSVLKIDPITQTTSLFGNLGGTIKWISGVLAPDGCIYGIPYYWASSVLKIDPVTQTTSLIGNFGTSIKWNTGVLAPDGCIYGIPADITSILKIELNSQLKNFNETTLLSAWINKF